MERGKRADGKGAGSWRTGINKSQKHVGVGKVGIINWRWRESWKGSNLKERGIESSVEGNKMMKDWEGKWSEKWNVTGHTKWKGKELQREGKRQEMKVQRGKWKEKKNMRRRK